MARNTHPKVVLCIVEEEPHLPVAVGQKNLLQGDHVWMFKFSQQLENTTVLLLHEDILNVFTNYNLRGQETAFDKVHHSILLKTLVQVVFIRHLIRDQFAHVHEVSSLYSRGEIHKVLDMDQSFSLCACFP